LNHLMERRFDRSDGMSIAITVELEKGKSRLKMFDKDGRMIHIQFVDDVEKMIGQIRMVGFEES